MLSSNSACCDLRSALFTVSLHLTALSLDFHAGIPWEHVVKICCIAVFCLRASKVGDVFSKLGGLCSVSVHPPNVKCCSVPAGHERARPNHSSVHTW